MDKTESPKRKGASAVRPYMKTNKKANNKSIPIKNAEASTITSVKIRKKFRTCSYQKLVPPEPKQTKLKAHYTCLMHRLSRLKDGWQIIMRLVLTFITLITNYTYISYQTCIETYLVSTARSLTSVGQTAVQRILICMSNGDITRKVIGISTGCYSMHAWQFMFFDIELASLCWRRLDCFYFYFYWWHSIRAVTCCFEY